MDDTKLNQIADFMEIALEEMERENNDSAQEFVEDAFEMLQEEL